MSRGVLNGLQCRSKLDNWGPTHIHIFVFTDHKNNRFQKKLITQNTNIWIWAPPPPPPPQLSNLLRHRLCWRVGSRKQKLVLVYFIKKFVDGNYRVYILYRFIRPEGLFTHAIFAAISSAIFVFWWMRTSRWVTFIWTFITHPLLHIHQKKKSHY
jgi:hypothetical protein